jgi:serine/threonine protein kinase
VEEKDQERKRKFPVSHLQNGLSELARRGFNDRGVNAVLLEQYDYEMEKVLDRLADPTSEAHYKNIFGGVKVHSFDEDNLEALWDAARKAAAHRTPYHGKNYKAPAGLAYDAPQAARLVVGVQTKLQPVVSRFVLGVPRTAYRANDPLPAGLLIDESTGDIHGTPTELVSARRVTVTAFNGSGECSTTVDITVTAERGPEGLVYASQDTSDLIVNVQTKISPNEGFVRGLPEAKFQALSAALPAATSLESVLYTATSVPLARDTKQFTDLFRLIVVSARALMSTMTKVGQLHGDLLSLLPLNNDLDSQNLENAIADLKSQENSAAEAGNYAEAMSMQQEHLQKTEELNRYKTFNIQFLDPIRGYCNEMVNEADKLGDLVEHTKTSLAPIHSRGEELTDVSGSVAHELSKTSELADGELAWLQERELSGLNSTASSASQEVTKRQEVFKARFTDLMRQVGDVLTQLEQCQKIARTQLRVMQERVCDTSSKPLVMQEHLCSLAPWDHVTQMQKMIENSPNGKIIELEQMTEAFLGALKTLVSPCVDLLRKAPAMPEGATLDEVTGEVMVTLLSPVSYHAFTVRAFNDTGECSAKVVLSAKAQTAPSGLRYTDLPAASEYAHPTQSNGLLLTGDIVCLKCSHTSAGLPAGTFTVSPGLPSGLSLNAQTGDIIGAPSSDTSRKDYRVTLQNPAGKSECTLSLEVQTHTPPGPLEYAAALNPTKTIYVIFVICQSIVPIIPTKVDSKNNLILTVSPELPAGLTMDPRTGVIYGSPIVPLKKTVFTVTASNLRGSQSTKIVLAVAGDGQICHPKEWTNEMIQVWLKNELNCNEDDRSHFLAIDGRQLVELQSKEAVASKLPSVQGTLQVLIAGTVKALVENWDQTSQPTTPLQRPVGVKAGDKVDLAYFPRELLKEYAPEEVLGVGSYGIVVLAYFVQNGHKKFKVAIKLVFAGGLHGFTDTALRSLNREGSILGRNKSPHVVRLSTFGVSERKEVFWLIMEHLEGRSLDVITSDPDTSFKEEDIVRLALQMLSALDTLHKQNVIHRDVKPANIVDDGDVFKLIDLGAASVVAAQEQELNQSLVTQSTLVHLVGTHGFMSPEAYREPDKVGPSSDIYSLCATLYLLISRHTPFHATTDLQWLFTVAGNMEEEAPRLNTVCAEHGLTGVSSGLEDIIAKGLHKKIPDRYKDATEMRDAIESFITSKYSISPPKNWKVMPTPWQDVELVEVPSSSADFKDVAAMFHTTCSQDEWLITKVERVQNLPQWQLYQTHQRTVESRRHGKDASEKRLFHGTEKATIPKINRNSFNRSFCGKNATAYGKGVYFAVDASYSIDDKYSHPDSQGNKYMYLARVVVGDFCVGDDTMNVPPPLPGNSNLLLYDSTVNRLNQPAMHVIYHDAQAYPEYLITIRRR